MMIPACIDEAIPKQEVARASCPRKGRLVLMSRVLQLALDESDFFIYEMLLLYIKSRLKQINATKKACLGKKWISRCQLLDKMVCNGADIPNRCLPMYGHTAFDTWEKNVDTELVVKQKSRR